LTRRRPDGFAPAPEFGEGLRAMPDAVAQAAPLLTVMVSVREGHSHAEASLRSVLADAAPPFDLIYLDILSPPDTAAAIAALVAAHGGRVIRHDAWIAPATARKQAIGDVRTKYVLFVDNDVLIEPGSFARLIALAEAVGAGVVGPVYVETGDGRAPFIHSAGGIFVHADGGALRRCDDRLAFTEIAGLCEVATGPVDFVEYHCLLARTDFLRRPGALSDEVTLVNEHIDLCLAAAREGFSVWLEAEARAVFLGAAPRRLGDVGFFRRRWDDEACEASMAAFARRWPVADEAVFDEGLRRFLKRRRASTNLRLEGAPTTPSEVLSATSLAASRFALREQAVAHGYPPPAIRAIEAACDFATLAFDSLYRPDGRPFLNHLVGTASALVGYHASIDLVLAGLLHSAYAFRPDWMAEAEVTRVLASGGGVETIVRDLPRAKSLLAAADRGEGVRADALTVADARALAVEAANEVDVRLSGEYRASGRPPSVGEGGLALLRDALTPLELRGLALSAGQPAGEAANALPILGFSPLLHSFRLDAPARRLDQAPPREPSAGA